MRALLSPYELDDWSPVAMAALSLFDATATVRPEPEAGTRPRVREAPAMAALLDAWHWTGPLWRAGVLHHEADGVSALEEARAVAGALHADPRLGPIQHLTARGWRGQDGDASEALCRDLLGQGVDPGFRLPIVAALDALALRSGAVVCRGEGTGMLDRLERRGGARSVARFAVPLLVGADGQAVLALRDRLGSERETLARSMHDVVCVGLSEGSGREGRAAVPCDTLLAAADEWTRAFDGAFGDVPMLAAARGDDGPRRTMIVVSVAWTSPDPTIAAAARLASIVGGRRHERRLASSSTTAAQRGLARTEGLGGQTSEPASDRVYTATIKRVDWRPNGGR